jgi:threonine 3-dehydrogenase
MTAAVETMPDTMTIPRFVGEGKVDFTQKPVPRPGPGQLLVRVHANALCGSDRHQFLKGSHVTPGHEAAGTVVLAGPGTSIKPGTPGAIFLMDFCGACRSCKLGLTNTCLAKRADMGFSHDGGYNPYELINENIFFPVDAGFTPTDATLLLDIMGTGGHAIGRARKVHPDIQSVLVLGAGPIGLGVLAMAKLIFGYDVSVAITDVIDMRLKLAEDLGGTPLNVQSGTLAAKARAAGLAPFDIAIDTSGRSEARQAGLEALNKRGVFVCVGHGGGLNLDVSPQLIASERTVMGSEYFCFDEMAGNMKLLKSNLSYMRKIVTHRFPLSEIQHAYELFFAGNTGKVVIEQ